MSFKNKKSTGVHYSSPSLSAPGCNFGDQCKGQRFIIGETGSSLAGFCMLPADSQKASTAAGPGYRPTCFWMPQTG